MFDSPTDIELIARHYRTERIRTQATSKRRGLARRSRQTPSA